MKVKFWGVRGSLPSPHTPLALKTKFAELLKRYEQSHAQSKISVDKFIETLAPHEWGGYGGNTPCVEVKTPHSDIIIDGGSGIRLLGYQLLQGPCGKGKGEVHILFTHFHWDHLIGLPFFTPIFIPGNTIHVYAVQPDLPDVFLTLFRKPYFPVQLVNLGATIKYHRLDPRVPKMFGDVKVTPYQLDHPDPCWGFRIEHGGKVFSHCVDTEAKRLSQAELGPDLPLYQGVDLMAFDAQYTILETIEKIDWGHAAASLGLDLAIRERVKRILFMHHDPASSDQKVFQAAEEAKRYFDSCIKAAQRRHETLHQPQWDFATEGLEIEL